MHPTKEMLAYDAEIARLFPKNGAQQDEESSSESSGFQRPFSFFSSPNNLSSSAADSSADTLFQKTPIEHPSQNRLSDSSYEFNPPFNSSLQEPNFPGVSSFFSPSSEGPMCAHHSTADEAFFSSDFSSRHHCQFSNVAETIPNQNLCKHLFDQPNSRYNFSTPADKFPGVMHSSQCFPQTPRTTVADGYHSGNVTRPRAVKKSFDSGIVGSNLCPSMVTYTPSFQGATSNLHFESPGLTLPINVHFLPTAVNVPTGIGIPSNNVNSPSTLQVPSFAVTLSTPINIPSNCGTQQPMSQNMNPNINSIPKVATSPNVFKVSPDSAKSSSSSNSDDFIGKDKICTFCRKNGENPRVYMTHLVKKKINGKHVVTCPILRTYVCSICNASGDNAHTITYCPRLKNAGISVKPTTISLKNSKIKSDGKPRFPPKP